MTLWLKDTLERTIVTFLVAIGSLLSVDALSDFDADMGKKLGTAGIIAAAAFLKNTALPKSGLGLPPYVDIAARAAWSAVQAGAAVIVLAGTAFAWYDASHWQAVGVAALAAAISVVKGALALRIVPNSITPASLASADTEGI
jgi:hypothetical protein